MSYPKYQYSLPVEAFLILQIPGIVRRVDTMVTQLKPRYAPKDRRVVTGARNENPALGLTFGLMVADDGGLIGHAICEDARNIELHANNWSTYC